MADHNVSTCARCGSECRYCDESERHHTVTTSLVTHNRIVGERNALLAERTALRAHNAQLREALQAFLRAPSIGSDGQGSLTIVVQEYNLRAARDLLAAAPPHTACLTEHHPAGLTLEEALKAAQARVCGRLCLTPSEESDYYGGATSHHPDCGEDKTRAALSAHAAREVVRSAERNKAGAWDCLVSSPRFQYRTVAQAVAEMRANGVAPE